MQTYTIKVSDGYVRASLNDGQWSAPSAHRDGLRTTGSRGAKGLEYVLSAAVRIPEHQLFPDQLAEAITVEQAERL